MLDFWVNLYVKNSQKKKKNWLTPAHATCKYGLPADRLASGLNFLYLVGFAKPQRVCCKLIWGCCPHERQHKLAFTNKKKGPSYDLYLKNKSSNKTVWRMIESNTDKKHWYSRNYHALVDSKVFITCHA